MGYNLKYNDQIVSDHLPQVMDTNGFGKVMTWNVLMQCKFIDNKKTGVNFYNNGFKIVESEEEYFARIDLLTDVLQKNVSNQNIDIVCLQEFPKMSYESKSADYFIESINAKLSYLDDKHYSVYYSNNSDEVTIYNSDKFKLKSQESKIVEEDLNKELEKNAHRFNVSVLEDEEGHSLAIANVHLKGFNFGNTKEELKSVNETTKILHKLEELHTDHYLVTGDFNYKIHKYDSYFHDELHCNEVISDACFNPTLDFPWENNTSSCHNTIDGFLYC
ncbi:MAG: endonuclease/exonuclease/phosphatase family protein [Alphaproteobacteria bacterium]|nr:endonuclease/exonuclease/phosphatase family protein [Alphaproteobacteria bacterium]OJV13923.1 MAG: hypothetical protein BGO27_08520 [Alphaproteobacteria bacterium 33-17]